MLFPIKTTQFERDQKRMIKQKKNLDLLEEVIFKLIKEEQLEAKYLDHPLKGNWKGARDCHIQNDWVLIYRINKKDNTITFERMGSHSDLF